MTMTSRKRGGVLGAVDTRVQRGTIEEERLYCRHKEHDGSPPLARVNTFLPEEHGGEVANEVELIRSTSEEKWQQIASVKALQGACKLLAPEGDAEHWHVVEDDAAAATRRLMGTAWPVCSAPPGNTAMCLRR